VDTARAIAATGARCFLGTRDLKRGEEALKDILEPGRVELIQIDVGSLNSVRAAAKTFLEKSSTLNVLINNAAIMACPEAKSVDGFESQLAINFLGHFSLYKLLESTLLQSSTPTFHSRVVNVASSGHHASGIHFDNINLEGEYDPWVAYGQSKTATIYMTNEIERRYGSQGLHGLSLMPGGIATELQRYVPDELKKAWSTGEAVQKFWKSTAQGSATTLVAAIGKEWEGKGGVYLEDCQESIPTPPGGEGSVGYAAHAFDPDKETKLWDLATKMVGLRT
jgi:NAD(P)-dependent dehydrogenase (short-subunit alcohol dehydrogenase family)